MISDTKLQLILTLYKNDKLTFEEVKTLLQEEKNLTEPIQPLNPWLNPNTLGPYDISFRVPGYVLRDLAATVS
jgi:hypothetical protein